jgi:hypothetical protein
MIGTARQKPKILAPRWLQFFFKCSSDTIHARHLPDAGFLFGQEIDKDALHGGDSDDQQPDGEFAEAQGTLGGGGEPELDLGGAEGNDIAMAEACGDLGMIIDGGEGIGGGAEEEAILLDEFDGQMVVPDAGFIQAEVVLRQAADMKRKMADDMGIARHFAGKNLELDHQYKRRSTTI